MPAVIRGICPVVPTLFDPSERMHFEEMKGLIEALIADGVHGLAVFGVGSEFYKLTEAERKRLLEFFIDSVGGRTATIVSVTAHGTLPALEQATEAARAGADALMLLPPFFAAPDAGSILRHLQQIIGEAGIPVIVQYAPEETGITIPTEVFLKLSERGNGKLYVKVESKPAGPLVSRLTECGLKVLAGKGGLAFFEALERGAVGVMPGCSQADKFVAIYDCYLKGDRDAAFRLHNRIVPYLAFVDQSAEMFLAAEKYFLKRKGVITLDGCRRPDFALEDVHRRILDRYGEMMNSVCFGQPGEGMEARTSQKKQ
jgi:dihydrodipicolinate synthase/N-acetylneuraminate lyase